MPAAARDPGDGGRLRLVVALGGIVMVEPDGTLTRAEFALLRGVTRIGSSPRSVVRLPGLDPDQAEIVWDPFDEYVFVQRSTSVESRINGEVVDTHPLRPGDRLVMGDWTLTYVREDAGPEGTTGRQEVTEQLRGT